MDNNNSYRTETHTYRIYRGRIPVRTAAAYPIRIGITSILLVQTGEARLQIGLRTHILRPGTLLLLYPGFFIQSCEILQRPCNIYTVIGRAANESVPPLYTDIIQILHSIPETLLLLSADETDTIQRYLDFMYSIDTNESRTHLQQQRIGCIYTATAYKIKELYYTTHPDTTRAHSITADFLHLLASQYRTHRNVAQYAAQLHISPKHLSTVLKATDGYTAMDWIENFVISDAKILLRNKDLSIQNVANALNFSSQDLFGKYFRNATGITPSQYRKVITL